MKTDYENFIEWAKENEYDFFTCITEEKFRELEKVRMNYIESIQKTEANDYNLYFLRALDYRVEELRDVYPNNIKRIIESAKLGYTKLFMSRYEAEEASIKVRKILGLEK